MKRSVLAVAVATVLALLGCSMLWLYVRGADARAMANKEATRVLVATKRIPAGTTGAEVKNGGYVELVTMPKGSVPSDALGSIDASLEDLALNADVQTRQLLLRGAFAAPTKISGGLQIPEGKIAVTVAVVNDAGTVFLQPGSKIAVFRTYTVMEGTSAPAGDDLERSHPLNHATRLVLPSVEVIATGFPGKPFESNGSTSSTSEDQGSGGALGASEDDSDGSTTGVKESETSTLVTVAVTQDEAERLIHTAQLGRLYIAILDGSTTLKPGPGVDYNSLFN